MQGPSNTGSDRPGRARDGELVCRVSSARMAACIAAAVDVGLATGYRMLSDYLRECGIAIGE